MNKNDKEKVLEMLKNSKSIAVIGMKDNEVETAYKVPYYLWKHGYKVFPVNPKNAGKEVLGKKFTAKVNEIKEKIDLVNIFRRPEFLNEHAKEILKMKPLPKFVWFQLGIVNNEAAKMLEDKGIKVVRMNALWLSIQDICNYSA